MVSADADITLLHSYITCTCLTFKTPHTHAANTDLHIEYGTWGGDDKPVHCEAVRENLEKAYLEQWAILDPELGIRTFLVAFKKLIQVYVSPCGFSDVH